MKNEDWFVRGVKNVAGLPRPVPYEIAMQNSEWLRGIVTWFNRADLELLSQSDRLAQLTELMKPASVVFVKLCYSSIFLAILIALIVLSNLALNSPWGRKVRAIRDN